MTRISIFLKDHKTELALGAAHGLVTALFIGFWALLVAPVSAFLFAWGGSHLSGSSAYRRIGVPVLCVVPSFWGTGQFLAANVLAFWCVGVLSIGYGLPSTMPHDEGSFLGRLVFKQFKLTPHNEKDEAFANLILRGGLLALFVVPFIIVRFFI